MNRAYQPFLRGLGRLRRLGHRAVALEVGQGATEYGLLVAMLVISVAGAVGLLGAGIANFVGAVANQVAQLVP